MLYATIASFFYENVLSFNVADSPSFKTVINHCIDFGKQHPGRRYKAPNRRKIGGPLLDTAYEATTVSAQPIIDRVKHYGGTLASDGWSNVQTRQLTLSLLQERAQCFTTARAGSSDLGTLRERGSRD